MQQPEGKVDTSTQRPLYPEYERYTQFDNFIKTHTTNTPKEPEHETLTFKRLCKLIKDLVNNWLARTIRLEHFDLQKKYNV